MNTPASLRRNFRDSVAGYKANPAAADVIALEDLCARLDGCTDPLPPDTRSDVAGIAFRARHGSPLHLYLDDEPTYGSAAFVIAAHIAMQRTLAEMAAVRAGTRMFEGMVCAGRA